jgi:glycosyltransferase involved in cell wall biosynthesis
MTEFYYEKNKVSILIPVYNRESLLGECIESALNQTYYNFEIVIVDNASTDRTWDVCQAWAERDHRIRIFKNDSNLGPVRNWQRCARLACGEYSKFLFSDDLLLPGCIEDMVRAISKSKEISFVYCSALIGKIQSEAILNYHKFQNNERIRSFDYIKLVLNGMAPVSPGAVMMRTYDLINNLHIDFPTVTKQPFEKHGAGPDVMLLLSTADNYKYVQFLHVPLVFFRAHSGSISITNREDLVRRGYIAIFCYYLKKNSRLSLWSRYVASLWLKSLIFERKISGLRKFSIVLEGSGSAIESVLLMLSLPYVVLRALKRKLYR